MTSTMSHMTVSVLFLLVASTYSNPLPSEDSQEPECRGWTIEREGDGHRSAVDPRHRHWIWEDTHMVPYVWEEGKLTELDKEVFRSAMAYVSSVTCIKFEERTIQEQYLEIYRSCFQGENGCFSGSWVNELLGMNGGQIRLGTGASLSLNWGSRGHIAHELLHVLGFAHTQKRPDRDDYITVSPGWINHSQFQKDNSLNTFGVEYDCMSVMHYRSGGRMTAKDPNTCDVNSANRFLTWRDIDQLNIHYSCPAEDLPFFVSGQGEVTSHPSFPETYDNNIKDRRIIQVKEGNTITLTWTTFDLEDHTACGYDYVEVVDGDDTVLMEKTCGSEIPPTVTSNTNRLHIEFITDGSQGGKGYQLSWQENGGEVTGTEGVITSPNYPENYDAVNPYVEKTYPIEVAEGSRISLTFTDFSVEEQSSCGYDWVQVEDGDGTELLGRSCGFQPPAPVVSNTNSITVTFHSDYSVTERGFSATWQMV